MTTFAGTRMRKAAYVVVIVLLGTLVALPAIGVDQPDRLGDAYVSRLSESVQYHYYLNHPELAPEGLRRGFAGLGRRGSGSSAPVSPRLGPLTDRFNLDRDGMPQNEESVTVCQKKPKVVLTGTNDYRGLLDPDVNFTGWDLSTDGGATVAGEGLLPTVDVGGTPTPSGGDPVEASDAACHLYAATISYNPDDPAGQGPNPTPSGVVVYRSNVAKLTSPQCGDGPTMSDPDCWGTGVAVAWKPTGPAGDFLDKDWMTVGDTGDGVHVWVTYSDFTNDFTSAAGFSKSQVYAVRCDADLTNCTAPILISDNDDDVGFSYVTVGPDHRTYVTWEAVQGELQGQAQTFTPKIRIAPAGSTTFGPEHSVVTLAQPLGFDTFLHADDFRVATGPKNDVKMVGGHARVYLTFDTCNARLLDTICEEPRIVVAWSDDDGAHWKTEAVSAGGDNYFPTLAVDHVKGLIGVAWFTNRFDPFHHRQDIELATLNPSTLKVIHRQRVTGASNEPDADPLLGGSFIGDYIQMVARAGRAFIGYNANYRQIRLLGSGFPVNQQDDYLAVVRL